MIPVEKCLRLVLGVMLHIFLNVFGQIALADLALWRQVNGIGGLGEFAEDGLLFVHYFTAGVVDIIVATTTASRLVRRTAIKPGNKLVRWLESSKVLIWILLLKLTVEIIVGLARERPSRAQQGIGLLIEQRSIGGSLSVLMLVLVVGLLACFLLRES